MEQEPMKPGEAGTGRGIREWPLAAKDWADLRSEEGRLATLVSLGLILSSRQKPLSQALDKYVTAYITFY